jgi:kynurenine formamidase
MIGWVLVVAVLLIAKRPTAAPETALFRQVVDLTHTVNVSAGDPRWDRVATRIEAPAQQVAGHWTIDQVPPERLVAPLVVLDVRSRVAANPDYQVSLDDIARWETANGHVPPGAVVMARTGWEASPTSRPIAHPGFSSDAVRFLVEGRVVFGVGIDTPSVDSGSQGVPVRRYLGENRIYALENVANLDRAPSSGAMVIIAPSKIGNGAQAPVRLLALVR